MIRKSISIILFSIFFILIKFSSVYAEESKNATNSTVSTLENLYKERNHQLIWFDENGITPCGQEVLHALSSVEEEGLSSKRYEAVLKHISTTAISSHEELYALDQELTRAAIDYISIVGGERNNLRAFDKDLHLKEKVIDEVQFLKEGLASRTCGWIHRIAPQHPQYQALKKLLVRYRQKEKAGGWPELPKDLSLKKNEKSPHVKLLREQLIAQDAMDNDHSQSLVFDEKLQKALKIFQFFHGNEPSGQLNKETIEALNIPVKTRIKHILLNLERWRWLPSHMGERYLIVNIPTYELVGVNQDKIELKMPIIVGKSYRRTPIFTSLMNSVILNPAWTVPYSIAVRDKLPLFSKNPALLRAKKYRIFSKDGQGEISPHSIDWSSLSSGHFPYVLRQDPGSHNALGKIKFNIQNAFSIYLHGTPEQKLFNSYRRAYSSGCIRVAFPIDLALFVLKGNQKWDRKALEKATQKNNTQSIPLSKPLPVYLTYMTVWINEEGRPFFAPDIYSKDKAVSNLMKAQK